MCRRLLAILRLRLYGAAGMAPTPYNPPVTVSNSISLTSITIASTLRSSFLPGINNIFKFYTPLVHLEEGLSSTLALFPRQFVYLPAVNTKYYSDIKNYLIRKCLSLEKWFSVLERCGSTQHRSTSRLGSNNTTQTRRNLLSK